MRSFRFLLLLIFVLPFNVVGQIYPLIVGTYTGPGKNKGVHALIFDSQDGSIIATNNFVQTDNPSFTSISEDGNFVYSVNESGEKSGVSAFKFDHDLNQLKLINRIAMSSLDPCYIVVNKKHAITANYSSGDVSVFPIDQNGGLKDAIQTVKHTGKSLNPIRQNKPHAHMIAFTPDRKHILVSDLGIDKVILYTYDENSDEPLTFKQSFDVPQGAGPRHMTFSNDGKTLFVLGELDGNIHIFDFENNQLKLKNSISTIFPARDINEFNAAHIQLSADGKFLYASVRGKENIISVFEIKENGTLIPVQQVPSNGMGPRNFTISPDGAWLLVAHQNSQSIIVFNIDAESGKLTQVGIDFRIAAPVSLQFIL
ncbi:lactonase family protein [Pedobacter flavus]|uniref:Lactonase family protein n=1 Tax=Pedobacter flavus TaxID=3113906 RepID=A0ABU7GYC6_9SPHI|nr:lactonase family protein [Pedobacter sp. VNH31]MEE1884062.1 lactonase family protein [Pedobacter sp. VNH31]